MKGRSHRLQNSDPPDDWVDGSWTVDCVCGVNFDDGEEMVNCDDCGVWVHTRCSRYVKGDDIFTCDKCKSKSNRNDAEETEVAQLLVELPTKTMRMEASFAPSRPYKLWTDIPIEDRVHVQGIPGGDPLLFPGLSSVFNPELWKCAGYVPKKFNFKYREFPCWDDDKRDGDEMECRVEQDNENLADKGAGVLFSLSKDSYMATSVATLVNTREKQGSCRSKEASEMRKWESDGMKKERTLLRHVAVHSNKKRKEDFGTSKDQSGKKRTSTLEKDVDAKRSTSHLSKTAFKPTSYAHQLDLCEDKDPKIFRANTKCIRNKNPRNASLQENISDDYFAVDTILEEHNNDTATAENSAEAFYPSIPQHSIPGGSVMVEDKTGHKATKMIDNLPKAGNVAISMSEENCNGSPSMKDEGDDQSVYVAEHDFVRTSAASASLKDVPYTASDVKDAQILQDVKGGMSMSSAEPNSEPKIEEDDGNSRGAAISSGSDVKDKGVCYDHMRDNSAVKDTSNDHKAQQVHGILEVLINCRKDKVDENSGDIQQTKEETDDPEGSAKAQKGSAESKEALGSTEGQAVSGGMTLNSQACSEMSFSAPSTMLFKSPLNHLRSEDHQVLHPISKQREMADCNIFIKKEGTPLNVVRNEDMHEVPRKNVKERSKSSANATSKASHSGRNAQDSQSKQVNSDSKDSMHFSFSRASSSQDTATLSVSGDSTGSLHLQKGSQAQNKIFSTGLPQRGEKLNPSSKVNQSHGPPAHPSVTSNSSTTLSDEELALLLHQELNSSPRVPRVPRARHAAGLPQLASPSATSSLIRRTSNSGGKDNSIVSRRKHRDAFRDGFSSCHEHGDEAKKVGRVSSSPEQRKEHVSYIEETSLKEEGNEPLTEVHSVQKNAASASIAAKNGPTSPPEDRSLSSIRNSPRNISDDDNGTAGRTMNRTLPGLIDEIMSKGRRMTYEELCNAVLPHWQSLRKHNGERYAYSSHSQAVLDCLRNRHEWAQLVDRGPKTSSNRKRRKLDTEESDDNDCGKGKTVKEVEAKGLVQKEEFPKGKRKARKRRRLALHGRAVKDVRKRQKVDPLTDDDVGPFSNSSDESMFSEDEIQGGAAFPGGTEASASSDETGTS